MKARAEKLYEVMKQAHAAIEFVLEQQWLQEDENECRRRCSYPERFPDWDEAWARLRSAEVSLDEAITWLDECADVQSAKPDEPILCYADGGYRDEDGVAYWGFACYDVSGRPPYRSEGEVSSEYKRTSNVAEYIALTRCLEYIEKAGIVNVVIHMDSRLVINQVVGTWKVRAKHLKELRDHVRFLLRTLVHSATVELVWIPRAEIVAILGH